MSINIVSMLILMVLLLVGVAFLTLLERKVLGYIQDRKGPNKVGMEGILQPFREGVKLFSKEIILVLKSNYIVFYFIPLISIFFLIVIWLNYEYFTNIYFINYSILIIILILRLNGYIIIIIGWSSNSLYSIIGAIRSVAQTLSYEVRFILIILVQLILSEGYSLLDVLKWQNVIFIYILILYPIIVVFFVRVLAELNRRPMDFIEGESELVSGFNVEYFRGGFALIFLAEYGIIIFISYLIICMYIGLIRKFYIIIGINLIILRIICIRGILPRMRYDELIYLCWKIILPVILRGLFFYIRFKYIFNLII